MHESSYSSMERFYREYYLPKAKREKHAPAILEVGSRDVNGSYQPIFSGHDYTGIDVVEGPGVDLVVDPWEWSFDLSDSKFGTIICGQTLEHDSQWWLTLNEIRLVAAPNAIACIIAPGSGDEHNPPDYYRFMPDAPDAWAEILQAELIESWWGEPPWCDCGGIFQFKG